MKLPKPDTLDIDFLSHDAPNFNKWLNILSGAFSPTSFKVAGWVSTISAAMQRRYWFGNLDQNPIIPNTYTVLAGVSGAGKGLILGLQRELLQANKRVRDKDLIRGGPDDTTYEALIDALSKCITPTDRDPVYAYCSMYLCLQEVESMFKKFAEKLCLFLICGWDADRYAYATKNSGQAWLRNISITICAGGVTKYVRELTNTRLMSDGFVGRTMFIFDSTPSSTEFFIPSPTVEQLRQKSELIEKLRQIASHTGEFKLPIDMHDYLTDYWKTKILKHASDENNRLNAFYARYREHIPKLAMCFQMGDSSSLIITPNSVYKAIHYLEHVTYLMHQGFDVPLSSQSKSPQTKQNSPELDTIILSELSATNGSGITWVSLYTTILAKHKIQPPIVQEAANRLVQAGRVRIDGVRLHFVQ